MRALFYRFVWLPVALLLLAAWACTRGIIPATGEKRYLGMSWEQEEEIGKEVSKEVAGAFGIYRDPELRRYVERVGQRVLAQSHLRRLGTEERIRETPVTFAILDDASVNAMAIPGGYIYVTRGLLSHLNSEDQLAAVLAHEIGHIAARHAARRAWQQKLGQGLLLGGALLGQVFDLPAEQILNLGGTAAQLVFLRHSRQDELEADRLSVEYGSRAGYDPRAAIDFFRTLSRIEEREGHGMPNFLSTHPDPGDRLQRIRELAGEWDKGRPTRTVNRSAYLSVIEGVVLGDDPRQGFVERNTFYHPELRFLFPVPRGFKLINQPSQVVMIDEGKRAIIGFRSSPRKTLRSAASELLSQGGTRIIDRGRTRSGELPAFIVVAEARADNNQAVRLIAYWVQHRGQIYEFIAYTAPQSFGRFRSEFLRTMHEFADLEDPDILRKEPIRLKLERARRSAPLRRLIPPRLPNGMQPEDVAILNQLGLNEEVFEGQMFKLPAGSAFTDWSAPTP